MGVKGKKISRSNAKAMRIKRDAENAWNRKRFKEETYEKVMGKHKGI